MAKFETGDIVRLKSGGPGMTVNEYSTLGAHCQWFAGGKLNSGYFSEAALVEVEDEGGNPGGQ